MISDGRFTPRPAGCRKIQQFLSNREIPQITYVEIWVADVRVSARRVDAGFDVDALVEEVSQLYRGLQVTLILGTEGEGAGE